MHREILISMYYLNRNSHLFGSVHGPTNQNSFKWAEFSLCGFGRIWSKMKRGYICIQEQSYSYGKRIYWLILMNFIQMCDQRGNFFTAFCTFFLLLKILYVDAKSHGQRMKAAQQITWIHKLSCLVYEFKSNEISSGGALVLLSEIGILSLC